MSKLAKLNALKVQRRLLVDQMTKIRPIPNIRLRRLLESPLVPGRGRGQGQGLHRDRDQGHPLVPRDQNQDLRRVPDPGHEVAPDHRLGQGPDRVRDPGRNQIKYRTCLYQQMVCN